MKLRIMLFLLLTGSILTSKAQNTHPKDTQKDAGKVLAIHKISKKLRAEVEKGNAYLIDVRTPEEYQEKHLKYSRNVDLKSAGFAKAIKKLDKHKPVYLYCRSGNRSGKAADSLRSFGYVTYNIGGLDSLTKAGFQVESPGH